MLRSRMKRHHLGAGGPAHEAAPRRHQRAPPLEQVGACIGCLDSIRDRMGKGALHDGVRRVGALGCPIPEGGPESVDRRPSITIRKIQPFEPPFAMRRYRPRPSLCMPGSESAFAFAAVSAISLAHHFAHRSKREYTAKHGNTQHNMETKSHCYQGISRYLREHQGRGSGGQGGIRTHDTLLGYTPLAGERLQPLGHLSQVTASGGSGNKETNISGKQRQHPKTAATRTQRQTNAEHCDGSGGPRSRSVPPIIPARVAPAHELSNPPSAASIWISILNLSRSDGLAMR